MVSWLPWVVRNFLGEGEHSIKNNFELPELPQHPLTVQGVVTINPLSTCCLPHNEIQQLYKIMEDII